jgi:hypothetical protein
MRWLSRTLVALPDLEKIERRITLAMLVKL